jgi:pimeloyl-ACP methyl ester carboxylesterase
MGAAGFGAIADLLAEDRTVVSYDPRGFARSTIDDPGQDAEPDLLADDARRVLEAVGGGPVRVFGSSGGAITALALVSQGTAELETVVAHEPPLALLLPDAAEARAGIEDVYDTYREHGIGAAWQRFSAVTGIRIGPQPDEEAPSEGGPGSRQAGPQPQPEPEPQPQPPQPEPRPPQPEPEPPSAEAVATSERFFRHGLLPTALYEADIPGLLAASARVVVAGGTASRGQFAQRTAVALAERLGAPLVEFPGGHAGFASDAEQFVAVLRRVLAGEGDPVLG